MADVTLMKTPAETALAQAFESAKTALPGQAESRAQAFEQFNSRGLPHRRVEEFKYTDLRALLREVAPFAGVPSADEAKAALAGAKALAGIEALQGPKEKWITLKQRIPVHLMYFTLRVDEDGTIRSYGDVYGHNKKLISLLNAE